MSFGGWLLAGNLVPVGNMLENTYIEDNISVILYIKITWYYHQTPLKYHGTFLFWGKILIEVVFTNFCIWAHHILLRKQGLILRFITDFLFLTIDLGKISTFHIQNLPLKYSSVYFPFMTAVFAAFVTYTLLWHALIFVCRCFWHITLLPPIAMLTVSISDSPVWPCMVDFVSNRWNTTLEVSHRALTSHYCIW